jgi:hypothetical protein
MGGTSWDSGARALYDQRSTLRDSGAVSRMAYTASIVSGETVARVHPQMDPKVAGTRQARDSAAHPESLPIAVFFDVTGSMGAIPPQLQARLHHLMEMLTDRGYAEHPAILIGAVGDATSDSGPLQVGQFESGIEIDDDLDRVWVEGGGGGSGEESYELAHYFAARHFATDSWDRRQKKGFVFTMGDENPYAVVSRRRVQEVIGDALEADIPTSRIVEELRERFHVFHLVVNTSTARSVGARARWSALLGPEHVVELRNPANVAELIASVIGLVEGRVTLDDVRAGLSQVGVDADALANITASLEAVAARAIRIRPEPTPAS